MLDLGRARAAVADAYRQAAQGPVLSSPPALLMRHSSSPQVEMKVKGAQLPRQRVSGFRVVADRHDVASEVSYDVQILFDMDSAQPIGIVAMNALHAVRTALTAAVALQALHGRPPERVAILGAGRIAAWLVKMLDGSELRVVGSRPGRASAFGAMAADTIEEAVAGSDAVIGVSSAARPILHARHLRPGITVIGMGGGAELDISVLQAADRFIVDDFAFARVMGSLGAWIADGSVSDAAAQARVDARLGEVLDGQAGRTGPDQIVFAIVQGMACCDLAITADLLGLGRE